MLLCIINVMLWVPSRWLSKLIQCAALRDSMVGAFVWRNLQLGQSGVLWSYRGQRLENPNIVTRVKRGRSIVQAITKNSASATHMHAQVHITFTTSVACFE